jgi:N-acetylglucosamine-6-phosphate deacetylase
LWCYLVAVYIRPSKKRTKEAYTMSTSQPKVVKFTNGLLLKNGELVAGDLWVSSETGRIISPQSAFYSAHLQPDRIVDLEGKILSPGFIDVQINGYNNFDFSTPDPNFAAGLIDTAQHMIKSGLTSYVPTVISTRPDKYHAVLPHLGSSKTRDPSLGCESLGAHVEGPFLSPIRNGIHNKEVLLSAQSWADIESCYGVSNLSNIRYITAAPEKGEMMSLIPSFIDHGIGFSVGHSDATFEQAQLAMAAGATMVTHLFNAMRPFGHRDPGIFGLLGQSAPSTPTTTTPRTSRPPSANPSPTNSPRSSRRTSPRSSLSISTSISDLEYTTRKHTQPFFGLIADGIHLSPPTLKIAYSSHPTGAILVTDAQKFAGCPDGAYPWRDGEDRFIKQGKTLTLESNGRIAGSVVDLIDCVNNFRRWTGVPWGGVLECVTGTPARMLGADVAERKGGLGVGMDADLVVLEEGQTGDLGVRQVWKFGVQVV